MKKHYILFIACCFAAFSAWATDGTVVETFALVGEVLNAQVSTTAPTIVNGDLCLWEHQGVRRDTTTEGFSDKMESGKLGWWTSGNNKNNFIRTKEDFEGGVKHIDLVWKQSTTALGATVIVDVIVGSETFHLISYQGGNASTDVAIHDQTAPADCNIKHNAQITITNLSTTTNKAGRILIGDITITPYLFYADKSNQLMRVGENYTRDIINNTAGETGTLTYISSDESVATVDGNGQVTAVARGEATITAKFAWDENVYVTTSYNVFVWPADNAWPVNLETFDGAHNVTLGGSDTYLTTPTASFNPSTSAGLTWTTYLGSVRDNLGGLGTDNIAAVIRSRKPAEVTAEKDNAYLLSSTISGGIDSIAFDWSCNGTEASREHPWNIEIYINDEPISTITDACTAIPNPPYRFTKGNLKVEGDFTIKIVNKNDADANSNHYRWVVDNIEWYGYEPYAVTFDEPEHGSLNVYNGMTSISSGTKLKEGTVLRIVPEPDDGYVIDKVQVNGVDIVAVEDVYSYTMIAAPAAISATFKKDSGTSLDNTADDVKAVKVLKDGMLIIEKNGVLYNVLGIKL